MRAPGYRNGPLVIPGVVEIILSWAQGNSKNASNVLHADNPFGHGVDVPLADAILTGIGGSAEWTAYALTLNGSFALQTVKVRNLDVALSPQFESTGAALPGTGVAGTVPESVALVATLKTAVAGRSGRGRTYLTGFDTAFVDAQGHAVAGLTAAAEGFMGMVTTVLDGLGLSLCVASRSFIAYTSPATGAVVPAGATLGDIIPASSHGVVSIKVEDNVFDSQRRRK